MNLYQPIILPNLKQISENALKILKEISSDYLTDHNVFYSKLFLEDTVLKESLTYVNLFDRVTSIGCNVMLPYRSISIHTDMGRYDSSLNIPLSGYIGSRVNFYKSLTDPIIGTLKYSGIPFQKFEDETCELLDSFELNTPYIINVKVPHNVVNNTPNTRVALLIRLKSL
jgi:hypothetical protein